MPAIQERDAPEEVVERLVVRAAADPVALAVVLLQGQEPREVAAGLLHADDQIAVSQGVERLVGDLDARAEREVVEHRGQARSLGHGPEVRGLLARRRQRGVGHGQHQPVVAEVARALGEGDRVAGGSGVAAGDQLRAAGRDAGRLGEQLAPLDVAHGVVLAGRSCGDETGDAAGDLEVDQPGVDVEIDGAVGPEGGDDRGEHAFEVHDPSVPCRRRLPRGLVAFGSTGQTAARIATVRLRLWRL